MPIPGVSDARVAFSDPQVNLYAYEVERSIEFYRDVLGFAETFRTPKQGVPEHVELRLGSFCLGLASFDALSHHHGIRTGRGPPRGEVALFSADVDGAFQWSTARGAPALAPPRDFGGYLHNAVVADPDGNPVVFTSRLPVTTAPDGAHRPTFANHLYNLYVVDLERSLRFYRDLFGFAETFRSPKSGPADHVELELGPLNLAVSTVEALKRHHGISGGGGPPRGEVALRVADADAALEWVNAQGAPTMSRPHDFAGTLRGAWVADPDGNPVQLFAVSGTR